MEKKLFQHKNNSRNVVMDIAKGIGILLMVCGHAFVLGKHFYTLFHMPLFFIISGYFIKDYNFANLTNVVAFVKKRFLQLWVPFFLCNAIFVSLNNFFISINIYTNNLNFLTGCNGNKYGTLDVLTFGQIIKKISWMLVFSSGSQLGEATWFFRVLFWISISYVIVSFVLSKMVKNDKLFDMYRFILFLIALGIGFFFAQINFRFYNIGIMFSSILLLYLGVMYKKYEKFVNVNLKIVILCIAVLLVMVWCDTWINLAANKYVNPFILLLASVSGFFLVLYLSKITEKSKSLANVFSYLGKNTIPVLCLHFLFFKLVLLLQIYYYDLPLYRLASFPCYRINQFWSILYTIVGVCGPIFSCEIYRLFKRKIKSFFTK